MKLQTLKNVASPFLYSTISGKQCSIRFLFTMTVLMCTGNSYAQDSATIFLKSGEEKFSSRLYNAATLDFEKAIKLNPNLTDAYVANGKANLEMNRLYQAGESFQKAYELQPENKEVIRELMILNYNGRQNQKAIDFARKCSCEESDRITGMSYYRMENYGQAEKYLLSALKNNEKDGEAAYTLGLTYIELEKGQEAIANFQKAVNSDPTKSNWHYELGLLYYNAGNYKGAVTSFQKAADAGYRQTNDFLENMGFCQLYSGDVDNALQTLNTVLSHKPNNTTMLTNIAYAMYATKRYQGAVEYYEKVLTINPKDASSLYMAGMAFQKMGQKQKGQAICDKAIEMDPSLAKNRTKKEMPMGL